MSMSFIVILIPSFVNRVESFLSFFFFAFRIFETAWSFKYTSLINVFSEFVCCSEFSSSEFFASGSTILSFNNLIIFSSKCSDLSIICFWYFVLSSFAPLERSWDRLINVSSLTSCLPDRNFIRKLNSYNNSTYQICRRFNSFVVMKYSRFWWFDNIFTSSCVSMSSGLQFSKLLLIANNSLF